jgi:hypothetical protein
LQRQKKMDLSDDEKLDNKDLMGAGPTTAEESENDDDLEEAREIRRMAKE